MVGCRTRGKVVAMDFSYPDFHEKQYVVLHFVDEASRCHGATALGPSPGSGATERPIDGGDANQSSQRLYSFGIIFAAPQDQQHAIHMLYSACVPLAHLQFSKMARRVQEDKIS